MATTDKVVIHLVGNAHLDPVWLWRAASGVDKALATCRTACDLLDQYPEVHITRGESWVYEQVERVDPVLFERIRRHVADERWHLVNGWLIQADCNYPSTESFRRHGEIGQGSFRKWFGKTTRVGYSVDAFGHTAMIPKFLRDAGMDRFVFHRPDYREMTLPDLFVWRAPTGEEVLTARIRQGYMTANLQHLVGKMNHFLEHGDRAIGHLMFLYGVGDHGGGPTREQIDWLLEHRDAFDGFELRFSHPAAYFEAVEGVRASLPVIAGELQPCAVGCYSVVREIKSAMRRAEELAVQADAACAAADPSDLPPDLETRRERGWKRLLFNQFHDILPGTSIQSACAEAVAELGAAQTDFREIAEHATQRATLRVGSDPHQRMVLHNLSREDFDGYLEVEPDLDLTDRRRLRLTDEDGHEIPMQLVRPEAAVDWRNALLFRVKIPALGRRVVRIHRNTPPTPEGDRAWTHSALVSNNIATRLHLHGGGVVLFDDPVAEKPRHHWFAPEGLHFLVREDFTDTWSHGVNRLDGPALGQFRSSEPWSMGERGPWRASMTNVFHWRNSRLVCKASLYGDDPWARLLVRVYWNEPHCALKMVVPSAFPLASRLDAMPGAPVARPVDGDERPMTGWTLGRGTEGVIAVVSRDVGSVTGRPEALELTLHRSPVYAHHEPLALPSHHDWPVTGIGMQEYRISLRGASAIDPADLDAELLRQANPVRMTETTFGMPPR